MNNKGFSLIEKVMAMGILGIVSMGAAGSIATVPFYRVALKLSIKKRP